FATRAFLGKTVRSTRTVGVERIGPGSLNAVAGLLHNTDLDIVVAAEGLQGIGGLGRRFEGPQGRPLEREDFLFFLAPAAEVRNSSMVGYAIIRKMPFLLIWIIKDACPGVRVEAVEGALLQLLGTSFVVTSPRCFRLAFERCTGRRFTRGVSGAAVPAAEERRFTGDTMMAIDSRDHEVSDRQHDVSWSAFAWKVDDLQADGLRIVTLNVLFGSSPRPAPLGSHGRKAETARAALLPVARDWSLLLARLRDELPLKPLVPPLLAQVSLLDTGGMTLLMSSPIVWRWS
ncbi:hypothetical protein FOZ60_001109, partial [Perkinsus olseni]